MVYGDWIPDTGDEYFVALYSNIQTIIGQTTNYVYYYRRYVYVV